MKPCYIYRVTEIVKVHDGDTYQLRLDLGFRVFLTVIIRLHGWNCPELSDQSGSGITARDKANELLHAAKEILVESFKDERSFERWVCDVYIDGNNLGQALWRLGFAELMK